MSDFYQLKKAPAGSEKKWAVTVPTSSGRSKTVLFGARGYEDYTQHKDRGRWENYRSRHRHDRIDDPTSPGFWSWHVLWGESTSLQKNFAAAVKRAKHHANPLSSEGGPVRGSLLESLKHGAENALAERFRVLSERIGLTNVTLIVDETLALAGREPTVQRAFAATDGDFVFVRPRMALQPQQRIDAILMHELGHAWLIQHGHAEHDERECDAFAEEAFGVVINYDDEDVQTLGPGQHPRPHYLDVRSNPASECSC